MSQPAFFLCSAAREPGSGMHERTAVKAARCVLGGGEGGNIFSLFDRLTSRVTATGSKNVGDKGCLLTLFQDSCDVIMR